VRHWNFDNKQLLAGLLYGVPSENQMANGKVTNEQIFALLERTSQNVQDIKEELASYKEKIEELQTVTQKLQAENTELRKRIVIQDEIIKRKNILVFGLEETENSLEQVVLDFLSIKLQIKITSNELDDFYRIGDKTSNKRRPILIKFLREKTAKQVLKHAKNLKGSGISIAQDLPLEKRTEKKILYDFLKVAKEKKFSAKIQHNKLHINKDVYTIETLKHLDKQSFLEPIVNKATLFPNNSAPPTPTIEHNEQDSSEDEEEIQLVDVPGEDIVEPEIVEDKARKETKDTKAKAKAQNTALQTPITTRARVASGNNNLQLLTKKISIV